MPDFLKAVWELDFGKSARLVGEDNIQKLTMNFKPALVIVNEAQLSEPIHEETDP